MSVSAVTAQPLYHWHSSGKHRVRGNWITVSNPNYLFPSGDVETDQILRNRNDSALCVGDCHGDDTEVFAIGINRAPVGREFNRRGSTSGLDLFLGHQLAVLYILAPRACRRHR